MSDRLTKLLDDAERAAKDTGLLDASFGERLFDLLSPERPRLDDAVEKKLARIAVHRFSVATGEPTWSSALLARAFELFRTEDLALALAEILGGVDGLSDSLAHFLDDFLKRFALARGTPQAFPITNAAQAYLAAWMIPDAALTTDALLAILEKLAPTPWFDAAVIELADPIGEGAVKDRLLQNATPDGAKLWVRVQRALRKVG
jgi:hypothetical protein